jgi:hypothetical protein
MSWREPPGPSTFEKAQRKKTIRRLTDIVKREDTAELLSLGDVQKRLGIFEQSYLGIQPIPVKRIVGTVERDRDFDRDFLPRRPELETRWKRVEQLFPGGDFPPIVVYQVGDAYFVVDGHHRVAIARQRGMETIDAEVTRLRTAVRFPADADVGRIILAEQERMFMQESGLERARPEARIEFSRPPGYIELLEHVKLHGFNLMSGRGEVLPMEEVAADWYDHVYLPAIEAIRNESLQDLLPRATEADLFLCVYQRRRAVFPERGGLTFEESVRQVREEERRRLKVRTRKVLKKVTGLGSPPKPQR